MLLHWSPRSPFVRKVMIGLHEMGLVDRVRTVRSVAIATKPNPDIQKDNPLNKIPTLVLDDGAVLYDSRVILEYLDTLHAGAKLCPAEGAARFDILRRQALADGLMDFVLVWRHEVMRPAELRSAVLLAAFEQKANAVTDRLEREIDGLAASPFSVAHIATGCALQHLDFRFASFDWRSPHPRLAAWHKTFVARPSVMATPIVDNSRNMPGPLSHIRVLDLSRIMAGPWSSQILADLGADVIKVERPGVGDDTRAWGPPYLKDKDGKPTGEAGYYLCVNRGKRSLTIDLNTEEGQAIVRSLAAKSDILLENYKVGTLPKFGLDYESLKKINPKLIYASVTGFGQDGPKAKAAAYDFMIQALGGLMSVTGERDDMPGGGPQKVGVPIVDLMTGMYTAIAVLAALARRGETGQGDYIDIAMLDVQVAFLANQAMNYLITGNDSKRNGNRHPNIQPQDVFRCREGYIVLAVGNDEQFVKFARAIGRPDLPADGRFTLNKDRVRNLPELYAIIGPVLLQRDMPDWVARLEAAGVPCAPINTIQSALAEPQVVHRRMLRHLDHPLSGTVPQVVSPMRFAQAGLEFTRPPPLLGQHTEEVLEELGFSATDIAELKSRKIV